jgi:hypothetical protein
MAWRGAQVIDDIGAGVATTIPYGNSQVAPGESLPGGWHPTVAYMLAFVVGEIILYGVLSKHLNII